MHGCTMYLHAPTTREASLKPHPYVNHTPSQVNDVPWPYTSKQQFDKTHSNPIGRHWNTEATFQATIKPRVTTATGRHYSNLLVMPCTSSNTIATSHELHPVCCILCSGCVIEPIKLTDDVQDFMKRTEKKKKAKIRKRKRPVSESL